MNDNALVTFNPERPAITDIGARALEVGSIRIGYKRDNGFPTKLDFFLVCSKHMEVVGKDRRGNDIERPVIRRDIMDLIAARMNPQPARVPDSHEIGALRDLPMMAELDVMVIADQEELAFYTYRAAYSRTRVLCRGFGVGTQAERWNHEKGVYGDLPCAGNECEWTKSEGKRDQAPPCRPHGVLRLILMDDPMIGGMYLYRTTSANTIRSIRMGLRATASFTGGRMAGLPFKLRVVPAQSRSDAGQLRKYSLVTCGYAGDPRSLLLEASKLADERMRLGIKSEVDQHRLLAEVHKPVAEVTEEEALDIVTDFALDPQQDGSPPALPPAAQSEPEPEPSDDSPPPENDSPAEHENQQQSLLPPESESREPGEDQEDPKEQATRESLVAELSQVLSDQLGGDVRQLKEIVESHNLTWEQPTKASSETLQRYLRICREYFDSKIPF